MEVVGFLVDFSVFFGVAKSSNKKFAEISSAGFSWDEICAMYWDVHGT